MSKVVFVCNMPGDEPGLTEILATGLVCGGPEKILVDAGPAWRRVGYNLVGPPRGDSPAPGDVGIYEDPAWVDDGRRLCTLAAPMPAGADGRWTHLHAKFTCDGEYRDWYKCPACGLEFPVDLPDY